MTTKQTKMSEKLKVIIRVYLAEDIREEANGKVSLVGLYPDNVVVLPLPDDHPGPTAEAPIQIRSLGILVNIGGLGSAATVAIELEGGGGRTPFFTKAKVPFSDPKRSVNLGATLVPCQIASFGLKKVVVSVDDVEHNFVYEIRRADAATMIPPRKLKVKSWDAELLTAPVVSKTKPTAAKKAATRSKRS